jgi:hypothetical protein
MDKALAVGIQDPGYLAHAALIAAKAGKTSDNARLGESQ